jgi:hypothetical protein
LKLNLLNALATLHILTVISHERPFINHLQNTETAKLTVAPTTAKTQVLRISEASIFIEILRRVPPAVPAFVPANAV